MAAEAPAEETAVETDDPVPVAAEASVVDAEPEADASADSEESKEGRVVNTSTRS